MGPGPISASNSSQRNNQSRRAGQIPRTRSSQSLLKSTSMSSPALHQQSFSMSSFSQPLREPVLAKTSKRPRSPFPPLSGHTSSGAKPDSEHNSSSQAPPIDGNNSSSTRNEETGHNAKGSVEDRNSEEQRRNATLDERNGSSPGATGDDPSQARHRRDHTPRTTAPGPNIDQQSVSKREQSHDPIYTVNSGSQHAHNAGTGTNLQPHSRSQQIVSTQPPHKPPPDTTTQHKTQNKESAPDQKRKIWSFIIRCECIHA